jgi:hypothetical protein
MDQVCAQEGQQAWDILSIRQDLDIPQHLLT